VTIPVSYSDSLQFTADFTLDVHLSAGQWLVDVVIVGVPSLTISAAAAAILSGIGIAAAAILAPIPFIGPFLAAAVLLITNTIAIAGVTGFLGQILTLFVSGLRFNIYKQPQLFQVLPASGPFDPAVNVTIALITADVEASDKNELVLTADI
jgi:hypothetical protein